MDQISEIILSDKEKTFYDFIFNYYAKNDSNMEKYITRESLTIIFKKSNLSKEQNITLWDKLMIKTKVPINTLYKGLKLISIAQNNPSDTSLQIEQPLPKIDEVPIQTLRADLEKASLYVLSAVITNTDYVKSGFLGINSYVVYTIESKVNYFSVKPGRLYQAR
jgi:hypothetical protein